MRGRVHQVVTFAVEPFRGNPAFALALPQGLSEATLAAVAAELREAVLAVFWPIEDGARMALEFLGPEGRRGGAGHSALAAAHLALDGRKGDGAAVAFRLADGSERIATREQARISIAWSAMPGATVDQCAALGEALGALPRESLVAPFGYVAVYDDPAAVQALAPDMAALSRFDRGAVIATAPGQQSDIVIRVFAPKLGLPEDPVCGTAHRILMPYWAERLGRDRLHSRQLSPRGGDLWCRLEGDQVAIAGEARSFLEGFIELPDE